MINDLTYEGILVMFINLSYNTVKHINLHKMFILKLDRNMQGYMYGRTLIHDLDKLL